MSEEWGPDACIRCGAGGELERIERCTICYKKFCLDCAVRGHGNKQFCSSACADVFFFGDDADETPADDGSTDWDE